MANSRLAILCLPNAVREAVWSLKVEGLIEIDRGRFGGSRVIVPRHDRLVHLGDIFVRANDVLLSSLLDCRVAIEPTMACPWTLTHLTSAPWNSPPAVMAPLMVCRQTTAGQRTAPCCPTCSDSSRLRQAIPIIPILKNGCPAFAYC